MYFCIVIIIITAMKKILLYVIAVIAIVLLTVLGASCYMLDYSLAPDPERRDTTHCWQQLAENYPETIPWCDSLKRQHALRDTFVVMPSGERHHAYYVRADGSHRVAIVLHGWRNCAIDFFYLGRIYHELMGYNVLMPDLHAHGLSDGEAIGMGWHERQDVLHWMKVAQRLFKARDFVVHGVSMGAATTMNTAGETVPDGIRSIRFVEDCGYTSVWDEFSDQLRAQFSLPVFPLLYTTSLLCQWRYGWNFHEAAPIRQVARCHAPMLFIHGDSDTFVPSWMVHPLYQSKQGQKHLWITHGTEHALSYKEYPEEYISIIDSLICQ